MSDWSDSWENQDAEMRESVERFERMLNQQMTWFFDAEELEQLFDYYQDRGNMAHAEIALAKGLEQSPDHSGFMLRKAQLLIGQGEIRLAEELLERALKQDPSMVELHLTRSSLYDYRNQTNRALQHLRKAEQFADQEQIPSVNLAFGMVYLNAGRYRSALDHLQQCVGFDQIDQEHLLYDLCYCYHQLELLDEGIAFFEKQISANPYSDSAWYNQGVLLNQAGLFEKAIVAFDYALIIQPSLSMAHFNMANTLINLEKFEDALASMTLAVEAEPEHSIFINGLGVCYEKLDRYPEALLRYEEASRVDPLLSDAWFGQATCKAYLEQWPTALALINKAIELTEDHEEYWYEKARILMALGCFRDAESALNEALRLDESFWEARILKISLFLAEDSIEQAMQCIQDGQEPHQEEAAYFYELSGLLYAFDMPELVELAATCLRWALAIDPSEAHHLLTFCPEAHDNPVVLSILKEGGALR
ncbi:MAG: tetratricopeptide repeat protein [Bacteroidetes bacterium]|nr:tetratricopeptide repeat protein [Bacteroidota bacterium]